MMKAVLMSLLGGLSLSLTACAVTEVAPSASSTLATSTTADSVIATERAFASRAGEIGWVPAFREFVAPDGQIGGPTAPVDAVPWLSTAVDDGNRNLFWWPAYAGISRSGDLAFTTGPVSFDASREARGHYFTVWRRQSDGSWKWVFDGGVGPIAEAALISPSAIDIPRLPVASGGVGGSALAEAQVSALEHAASVSALAERLSADAQVFRTLHPRAVGELAREAMNIPSASVSYRLLRTEASLAGDLVMTVGTASWSPDDGVAQGVFARIWQMRADGWRIVYDQLALPPPSPAADSDSAQNMDAG